MGGHNRAESSPKMQSLIRLSELVSKGSSIFCRCRTSAFEICFWIIYECFSRGMFVSFRDGIHFTSWGVGMRTEAKKQGEECNNAISQAINSRGKEVGGTYCRHNATLMKKPQPPPTFMKKPPHISQDLRLWLTNPAIHTVYGQFYSSFEECYFWVSIFLVWKVVCQSQRTKEILLDVSNGFGLRWASEAVALLLGFWVF